MRRVRSCGCVHARKVRLKVSTPKTQTTYFSEHPLHHYYDDGLMNFWLPRPCFSPHFSQHKRNTIYEGNEAGETRRLSAEILSGRFRSGTSGSGPWSAGCSRGSSVVRLLTFRCDACSWKIGLSLFRSRHVCICVYADIGVHNCTYICICKSLDVHVLFYIHTYLHRFIYVYIHMYLCTCIMYVHTFLRQM